MVMCRKCRSTACVKAGFMKKNQRYKCKQCGYYFIDAPRRGHTPWEQFFAVWLFINGMSQTQIGSLFNVSAAAVSKWVSTFFAQHKHLTFRKRNRIFQLSTLSEATKFFEKAASAKSTSSSIAVVIPAFEEDHPIYVYTLKGK